MGVNWSRVAWRGVGGIVWLAVMVPVVVVRIAWRIGRGLVHLARRRHA